VTRFTDKLCSTQRASVSQAAEILMNEFDIRRNMTPVFRTHRARSPKRQSLQKRQIAALVSIKKIKIHIVFNLQLFKLKGQKIQAPF